MRDSMPLESGRGVSYGTWSSEKYNIPEQLKNAQVIKNIFLPGRRILVACEVEGINALAILDDKLNLLALKKLTSNFGGVKITITDLHLFSDGTFVVFMKGPDITNYAGALFFSANEYKKQGAIDLYKALQQVLVPAAAVLDDDTMVLVARDGYVAYNHLAQQVAKKSFELTYRKCIGILPEGTALFITPYGRVEKRNLKTGSKETLPISYMAAIKETEKTQHRGCGLSFNLASRKKRVHLPHQVCGLPNGNLVFCSEEGLLLWGEKEKKEFKILDLANKNRSVFPHPSGGFVSVDKHLCNATVRIWSNKGQLLQEFKSGFYHFMVYPNGDMLGLPKYGISPVRYEQRDRLQAHSMHGCRIL